MVVMAESCTDSECKIMVSFKGTYLEDTCVISINGKSSTETVEMPTISTASLQSDGAETGSRPFSIALTGCPLNQTVSLRFISGAVAADSTTGNFVNTAGETYSQNVQIRLRDENGKQMIADDIDSVQDYVISSTGEDISYQYLATYYAKGTSKVTAGLINTTAGIDLIYK
ncbi:fimbrial protein [Buttiauxella agrestis]|uniref:fimbrial protein n=1 Tax=Buttiauxella agrestis TaxID=82977 RepID=UPI003976077B